MALLTTTSKPLPNGFLADINSVDLTSYILYVIQQNNTATYTATGTLATSDPHVVGRLWVNSGNVSVSAG